MALRPDQIDDFVNLTLSNFKLNKWVDLSMTYTEYVSSRLVNSKRLVERGGPDIRFKLQTKNTGLARWTGLFDTDVTGVEDLTIEGVIPWTKATVNWSYDIDEPLFQTDRETIVGELLVREHACMNDMVELMETALWSAPTATTSAVPMGIPFWIQKDASTTPAGAFNGGNPSGFSSGAASISTTTYPAWANWTFGYSAVTPDDLIVKIKKALYSTDFKAPNPHPELGFGASDFSMFTTYDVREPLERLAETRNDNLGNDVARYINNVLVGGVPIEAVPYLDSNDGTADPIYGVNWRAFRPFVKRGADMRQTLKKAPLQRTVRQVHYDTWMNYACYNRRACWVGSKA